MALTKEFTTNLKLDGDFIPLDWIEPFKNETIIAYAKRLIPKVDNTDKCCLIGVSFGGLVATEISKIIKPSLSILISSAETKLELRQIYKLFGKTKLIKLIPQKLFNPPRGIASYLFETKKKKLLNDILDNTNLKFAKWAVGELVNWKNKQTEFNLHSRKRKKP